jgi:hypothetical protein
MSVESDMQDILEAAAAVTALCPASRIRVPGNWQNLARPYIVHFPVTADPERIHAGLQGLCVWDPYQVSVFADSYSSAQELSVAIRTAVDGTDAAAELTAHWQRTYPAPDDPDTKITHMVTEFRVAAPLT